MSGEVLPSFKASEDVVSANVAGVSVSVDKKTAAGAWAVVRSWPAVVWLCLLGMIYSGVIIWYLTAVAFPDHIERLTTPLSGAVESLKEVVVEIKAERADMRSERAENNARMDKFVDKVIDSRNTVPLPNRDSTIGGGS